MAKRLTTKAVERLGIKNRSYVVYDSLATGLGLKVTPAGKRIWFAQLKYPHHRCQSRRTLGHHPTLGLEAARAKAQIWRDLCAAGRGSLCKAQVFPGNDVDGGFASHVKVPARGLCVVDHGGGSAAELARYSVLADAVTTP